MEADNAIPQAATAHDSAWDVFSQQTSTMAGYGILRSLRHMGKASLVWDEAQRAACNFWATTPEWELNLQMINEDQALSFGFDVLEEYAPLMPATRPGQAQ
ncbi:hypothetical protein E4U32_003660 [Claviceps aff. humidiphila group G2b]|nr:hypothetical protein E4U32_003660 [Claviceps aff. humidiphila group G2b]